MNPSSNSTYFILFYKTIEQYKEKRLPYRSSHLAYVTEATESGHLVLGGALDNPADEAVLVFKVADISVIKDFAENDPYVKNGLIKEWSIRPWTVVVGTAF